MRRGEYTVGMRWRVGLVVLTLATWGGCAKQDPDPAPTITAERLGEPTRAYDDAEPEALAPHPDDSVWASLTPSERQALADQGYEIRVNAADREAMRKEQEATGENAQKGKFGRAMDHAGRASVAVAAVAMAVGMMVAPFFLL